jgi:predicted DCC family thiol-disulfide oxidoreductase YuxK
MSTAFMQTTNTVRRAPLLIYDGHCEFCIYWVRYWQRLTEIPLAAFQRAVQYTHFSAECLKPETRWRRGRDSNPRYRLPSTPD